MKNRLFPLALLAALFAAGAAGAQPAATQVLFIGNSITNHNRMPSLLAELAGNEGVVPRLEIKDETLALARFRDQLLRDSSWSPLGAIRRGQWDIVILQGHSLEPLDDLEGFLLGAGRLADEVRAAGAEPLFLQTYSFPVDSAVYQEGWSGGSPAAMLAKIADAYRLAAERARARVVPIGEAFQLVSALHPEIGLYSPDRVHPSICGSFLMASMLFTVLTGKDPRSCSWFPIGVSEEEARVLREAAWQVCGQP
ncbi:MAG: hypothetical protein A2V99_08430 [Spirochaetes bacterium RBG_16_67_19]|nr:MAG: hypothetical protein A2V99_08430 [Spirochaetes bacterium RBG_16_67_19]